MAAARIVLEPIFEADFLPTSYDLLLPRDGLCILGGRGVYFRGAAARYLGLLAATLGRSDHAVRHHEEALEKNTRAQAPPWIARSLLDLARALLARGDPNDQHRIGSLLSQSESLAHTMGMQSFLRQVALQRTPIGARR